MSETVKIIPLNSSILKNTSFIKKDTIIILLFFLSGAVSLLYEIVWAKQLQFLFGSSIYSISTIISSFFSGMALGSYLLGKWKTKKNPIIIYAGIELTIGLYCLASFTLIGFVDDIYLSLVTMLSGSMILSLMVKFILCFFVLILPTTLMGGTLPVLSRYLKSTNANRGEKVGRLYGANTLGAVVGASFTGFFLIENYGLSFTALIGAYTSIGISIIAYLYGRQKKVNATIGKNVIYLNNGHPISKKILTAYGISGFCAIAYEVLWTRVLLQTLPSSTYTFSLILILYLLGIGLGSIISSRFTTKMKSPVVWFATIQILLALSIFVSTKLSEDTSFYQNLISGSWSNYLLASGLKTTLLIFVPSILMGSLFPVIIQWYKGKSKEIGNSVGKIYSVNTLGGILGSFCAGFLMIPFLGSSISLVLLATINLVLGLFFFKESIWTKSLAKWKYVSATFIVIALFITYGFTNKLLEPKVPQGYKQLFFKEGASANVGVYQSTVAGREYVKILKVNGVYQSGGTDEHAMLVQRRQGHLPMLLHQQPDSVLMIGLATGITLSAIAEHKKVKYIDCVEIVSSQIEAASQFKDENQNVLADKRLNVITDDGRSYIKNSAITYNVIVGDLFQMSSAGTSAMYTVEHIQACKDHLSKDGIMVQYIPLQQVSEENLKSIIKSFTHVFPFVQVWITHTFSQTPVLAIVASPKMNRLNISYIKQRIESSGAKTLTNVGYDNPYLLIAQCALQTDVTKKYIGDARLITLDHQRIEFSTPRILTKHKDKNVRLIMSNLLSKIEPLRVEVHNENSNEVLREISTYAEINKNNIAGELALGLKKWNIAEKILAESYKKIPDHFDTRRILGRANVFIAIDLLKKKKIKKATERLNKAKKLGIDDIMVTQLLQVSEEKLNN